MINIINYKTTYEEVCDSAQEMLKDLGYRFGQQASRPAGFIIIVKSIIQASKTAVAVSC